MHIYCHRGGIYRESRHKFRRWPRLFSPSARSQENLHVAKTRAGRKLTGQGSNGIEVARITFSQSDGSRSTTAGIGDGDWLTSRDGGGSRSEGESSSLS